MSSTVDQIASTFTQQHLAFFGFTGIEKVTLVAKSDLKVCKNQAEVQIQVCKLSRSQLPPNQAQLANLLHTNRFSKTMEYGTVLSMIIPSPIFSNGKKLSDSALENSGCIKKFREYSKVTKVKFQISILEDTYFWIDPNQTVLKVRDYIMGLFPNTPRIFSVAPESD